MKKREESHLRQLRRLEEQAEEEQQRIREDMERERLEREKCRSAHEELRERVHRQVEQKKREAEQAARANEQREQENSKEWNEKWWQNWRKSQERSREKAEEHSRWKADWWEQWKDRGCDEDVPQQDKHDHFDQPKHSATYTEKLRTTGLLRPPLSALTEDSECLQVLSLLCEHRGDALEDRKQVWRRLCLQWHPDKCADKEQSTVMFQYLQGLKDWFLV